MSFVRLVDWPYWTYHAITIFIGTVCYVVSAVLTGHFIKEKAPDPYDNDELVPGVKNWELTAGQGVVPRWVSIIGLAGVAFVLACPFEFIAALFR